MGPSCAEGLGAHCTGLEAAAAAGAEAGRDDDWTGMPGKSALRPQCSRAQESSPTLNMCQPMLGSPTSGSFDGVRTASSHNIRPDFHAANLATSFSLRRSLARSFAPTLHTPRIALTLPYSSPHRALLDALAGASPKPLRGTPFSLPPRFHSQNRLASTQTGSPSTRHPLLDSTTSTELRHGV
ncbi:RHTO0S07e03158g1_1 [Rhodotorula toruloides]|uniref:RHTO0S07e03158g1_1 n=1 Tax=Rhodotorula toruloides TaxID=5286 RepID=A0A061B4W4_RHOTO|nr:RHTO0S07e03158g1_1 [Rhodotorula toruloides]